MLLRIKQNYSPSRYATFMIKNIHPWKEITFEEVYMFVEETKFKGGIYSLFPFFYIYLGIDLYKDYYRFAKQVKWNSKRDKIQVKDVRYFRILIDEKSIKLNLIESTDLLLNEIGKRLIQQGASPVD